MWWLKVRTIVFALDFKSVSFLGILRLIALPVSDFENSD